MLLEMGRLTEALMQFHHCLKQQPEFAAAKNQIRKVWEVNNVITQTKENKPKEFVFHKKAVNHGTFDQWIY